MADSAADAGARAIGAAADVGFAWSGRRWCRRRSRAASYRVIDNRSENLQHCQWGALTKRAVVTRARKTAPIPARSDADRPAPAGWAALRLLADVDSSFSGIVVGRLAADAGARAIGAAADVGFAWSGRRWCRRRSRAASYRVIDNRSENLQHCQWGALTKRAVVTRARKTAPIPARSDADRPAPAGWAALRLLADVDSSF